MFELVRLVKWGSNVRGEVRWKGFIRKVEECFGGRWRMWKRWGGGVRFRF